MTPPNLHDVDPLPAPRQRVVLVTIENPEIEWEESLAELARLADTANGLVVATLTQRRAQPDPRTFLGKGKVTELGELIERMEASLVIVDAELPPSQQRNLERQLEVQTIDRTGLILDIFARRAQTAEGKLQVELAQLQYLLPRLTNMWSHLERIRGGIGLRGPGETQIETDRRLLRDRIILLQQKVDEIRHRRRVQRSQRAQSQIPLVSLVGYTNAGKSTLLNTLSNAGVFVEDKLFATLDPTTRDVGFPGGTRILLSDTVGFIRRLPTQLIAAFRATLEEVQSAELLIQVIDAASPEWVEQVEAVALVLHELDADDKPMIMAFNKMDMVSERGIIEQLAARYQYPVFLSARRGEGVEELEAKIVTVLHSRWQEVDVLLPLSAGELTSELHARGVVVEEDYQENAVRLVGRAPADLAARLKARAKLVH